MGEKLTRTQQKNLEKFGGVNPADEPFSRRQFAAQVGGYALAAGAAVGRRPAGPRPLGHGGRQAAAAGPAQGLLGHPGRGRPNLVVVRSRPVRAEDHASKEEELKAREEQAFAW